MAAAIDIQTDESGSPVFTNGDFTLFYSDGRHIEDILLLSPGNVKQWPLTGLGLYNYVNGPNNLAQQQGLNKAIRLQLAMDGFTQIISIDTTDLSNFTIEAIR